MTIRALFEQLLQGDREAVELCVLVFDWANVYDHLIDDQVLPEKRASTLHQAMWACTVGMHANRFFRQHQDELMVSFANAVSSWKTATALQKRADPHSHLIAHVLRWAPIEFFIHCARIVGGDRWADAAGPAFWLAMTKDHPLDEFLRECNQPQGA
jgi:hypothetical protein